MLVKTLTRWNISVIYGEINSHVDFPQGISDLVKKKNCSKYIYDQDEKLSNSDSRKTWMRLKIYDFAFHYFANYHQM